MAATLTGTDPDLLRRISMVGRDFVSRVGMCGSIAHMSGMVSVAAGQATLKVDDFLVGGNG